MVAGELLGLGADLTPQLPVLAVLPLILGGSDAQDVVGRRVGLAASRRQGDATDENIILGLDDDPIAYAQVEVVCVAELCDALARDTNVYEPGELPGREISTIFRRVRDNVTSRIASGETLYASEARASPITRAAPTQSAPPLSLT